MIHQHVQTNVADFDARALAEHADFEWQRAKVAVIAGVIRSIGRKSSAADIGCGTGLASLEYIRAGIAQLDGYDVSPQSVSQAVARGINAQLWNADETRCPAQDDGYDVVIAADVVEHLLNTDYFAAELFRVVAPGGRLIVSTPNLASWYNRLRLLRGLVPASCPGVSSTTRLDQLIDLNHLRLNIASEWAHLFEAQGFAVDRVLGASHLQHFGGAGARGRLIRTIDGWCTKRASLAMISIMVFIKPGGLQQ